MEIAGIGVGGAGGRIIDRLAGELSTGGSSPLETVHAIDTDTESLDALGTIPRANRHAIGQFETGGDGTGGDRELAAEIVENEQIELRRSVEDGIPTTVDAIVVAAGLAGGTASAVTPALVAGLAKVYEQPVYTISVLPAGETAEQKRANTAQALTDLNEAATAQIVFDNDAWLWGSRSIRTHSGRLNAALTERVGELLTVGQDGKETVGEQVIDAQDVLATLDGGGLVTVGYASRSLAAWRGASSSLLDGLKRSLLGDDTEDFERGVAIQRTLGWATRGTLTAECPRDAATHGLVAFRGPPEWLRGDAISRGREWVADRVGIERLRSGDLPVSGADSLDVLVVFAGIERTPRIEAFRGEPDQPADEESGVAETTEESGSDSAETASGDANEEPEASNDDTAQADSEDESVDDVEADSADEESPEEWGVAPGETGAEEGEADDEEGEAGTEDAPAESEDAGNGGADSGDDTAEDETEASADTDIQGNEETKTGSESEDSADTEEKTAGGDDENETADSDSE